MLIEARCPHQTWCLLRSFGLVCPLQSHQKLTTCQTQDAHSKLTITVFTHAGAILEVPNVDRELQKFASTEKWASILGELREQCISNASPQPPSQAIAELSAFVSLMKHFAREADLPHSFAAAEETSAQVRCVLHPSACPQQGHTLCSGRS